MNSENIEQWIFDYHEGVLSESEKTGVLDFLHQHPEYHAEFAFWAQTHGLKKEAIAVPADLLKGVLQSPPTPFWGSKAITAFFSAMAICTGLVGYFWWNSPAKEQVSKTELRTTKPTIITKPAKEKNDIAPYLQQEEGGHTRVPRESFSLKQSEIKGHAIAVRDTLSSTKEAQIPSFEVENQVLLPDTQKTPSAEILLPVQEKEEPETVQAAQPQAGQTKEKQKKKRNRLPFNVSPQSNFKPANPDF